MRATPAATGLKSGLCQTVHGGALDGAISDIVIEAMTPLAIEVALTVQQELATRHEEADRLRRQHVERARYEADLAQRRFLKVDPDNRLVADALEADWNESCVRSPRHRKRTRKQRPPTLAL